MIEPEPKQVSPRATIISILENASISVKDIEVIANTLEDMLETADIIVVKEKKFVY